MYIYTEMIGAWEKVERIKLMRFTLTFVSIPPLRQLG